MANPARNKTVEIEKIEAQQLHLSVEDREIFISALLNPSKPSKNLLNAAKKYKKIVISK